MLKRISLFLFEFLSFCAAVLLLAILAIQPHLKSSIKQTLQNQIGLNPDFEQIYVSPTGSVWGSGALVRGKLPSGMTVDIRIESFEFRPRRLIYREIWEKKEHFNPVQLPFILKLQGISFEGKGDRVLSFDIPEISIEKNELHNSWSFHFRSPGGELNGQNFSGTSLSGSLLRVSTQAGMAGWCGNLLANSLSFNNGKGLVTVLNQLEIKRTTVTDPWNIELNRLWGELDGKSGLVEEVSVQLLPLPDPLQDPYLSLKEIRLKNLDFETPLKVSVPIARIYREADGVKSFIRIDTREHRIDLSPALSRSNENWVLRGKQSVPYYPSPISYEAQGTTSSRRPLSITIRDENRCVLEVDANSPNPGSWIASAELFLDRFRIPNVSGPAISGHIDTGVRIDDGELNFLIMGDSLQGGPFDTSGLSFLFSGNFDGKNWTIREGRAREEHGWNAEISASVEHNTWTPQSLNLELQRFPLTRYSPTVGGEINMQARLANEELYFGASSDRLHPNKDPLQVLEKFQVNVVNTPDRLQFDLNFLSDGFPIHIVAGAKVKELLSNPIEFKDALLDVFHVDSQVFSLTLSTPAEAKMNATGMQLPEFHLADSNNRLVGLSGNAWIPFMKASEVNIIGSGRVNLGNFPPLSAGSVQGEVTFEDAVWDKGWSIRNIVAEFQGKGLELTPGAIFPKVKEIRVKGRMANSTIWIDNLEGRNSEEGSLEVRGSYVLPERKLDIRLKLSRFLYEVPGVYSMVYDISDLMIQGPIHALDIKGQLDIRHLSYTQGVNLFATESDSVSRPRMARPEDIPILHQLDLNVSNQKPLLMDNNVGQVRFNIPSLRIHGPLFNPGWTGTVQALPENNSVSLPTRFFRAPFKVESAQLEFTGESEWNPILRMRASREVDEVIVRLRVEERLNSLANGDFYFSSSPPMSREDILQLLASNRRPEVSLDPTAERKHEMESVSLEMPSIVGSKALRNTFISDESGSRLQSEISLGSKLSLSTVAQMDENSDTLEMSLNYRLRPGQSLEVSKSQNGGTFTGFRFSRQSDRFIKLFTPNKAPEEDIETADPVFLWKLGGLPFIFSGISTFAVEKSLSDVEPLFLSEDELSRPLASLHQSISKHFTQQGYPFASYRIDHIEFGAKTLARGGTGRAKVIERREIEIHFQPGPLHLLEDVVIEGWPGSLDLPQDKWLQEKRGIRPVYSANRLHTFSEKLLAYLGENGYPEAEIVSLESAVKPRRKPEIQAFEGSRFTTWESPDPYRRLKDGVPVTVTLTLSAGPPHTIEQFTVLGAKNLTAEQVKTVAGYKDGEIYSEEKLRKYQERILAWYEQNHFFNTSLTYQVTVSREYPRVSVIYRIDEGDRWKVGQIRFQGTDRTLERYLRAILPAKTGEPASRKLAGECVDTLLATGIFDDVELKWHERDDMPGVKDMIFQLSELPRYSLSVKLGADTSEGFKGSIRARAGNLAGMGRAVSLEESYSKDENFLLLNYSDSFAFEKPYLSASVSLIRKREIFTPLDVTTVTYLLESRLRRALGRKHSVFTSVIYQNDSIEDRDKLPTLYEDRGRIPSLRLSGGYERRNARLSEQPAPGFIARFESSFISYYQESDYALQSELILGEGIDFGGHIVTPWFRAVVSHLLGDPYDLPLMDRTFLGGAGSLRGFDRDELGGDDGIGEEHLMSWGIQSFHPVASRLTASLFYDAGLVFSNREQVKRDRVRDSFGTGLVLRTPVGPLQLLLAKPLEDRNPRLEIQLGMLF